MNQLIQILKFVSKHVGWAFSVLLFSTTLFAKELPEFYRGVRAMGMGGAFTAIADDEDAIFYNPAGLAFNQKISFHYLNPKLAGSKDDYSSISAFKETSGGLDAGTVSKLFGKNLYANATIFPSIYFPNFVLGYYYGANLHMVARNLSLPSIELNYNLDKGVVSGFGFETRGFSQFHYVRWGFGMKWLTRAGYEGYIPVTKLATADASYLKSLKSAEGTGIGASVGIQYDISINKMDNYTVGAAFQDVGDTQFGNRYKNNMPKPIRQNLSVGTAYIHRFGSNMRTKNNIKVSIEGRNLTESNIDPRLRMHYGTEVQFGMFSLQAGLNQTSLCAGFGLDLWLLKLSAVTYAVETQSLAMMDRERRYMLQLTMSFDMMGFEKRSKKEDDRYKYPRKLK